MNAAISARLAEVTMETLERLAFLFASPAPETEAAAGSPLETVRVDFTGHFTGGIQAGDGALVQIYHMSVGVDLHPAHGVMHLRPQAYGIIWGVRDGGRFL